MPDLDNRKLLIFSMNTGIIEASEVQLIGILLGFATSSSRIRDLTFLLNSENAARVSPWMNAFALYEESLYSHSLRVGELAQAFAKNLGFSAIDAEELTIAGLLHDVGKLDLDRNVLLKSSSLTEGEMSLMRLHPEAGCSMLRAEGEHSAVVLDVALRHHERLDGSGYPESLQAGSISEAVRMITMCDVFAAMTEERPYARVFDWRTALAVMASKRSRLDQHMVARFSLMIESGAATEPSYSLFPVECCSLVQRTSNEAPPSSQLTISRRVRSF